MSLETMFYLSALMVILAVAIIVYGARSKPKRRR